MWIYRLDGTHLNLSEIPLGKYFQLYYTTYMLNTAYPIIALSKRQLKENICISVGLEKNLQQNIFKLNAFANENGI